MAYVCQHPGRSGPRSTWARGPRCTASFGYHIGYLNFKNFREANDFICGIHEVLLPGEQWGFPRSEENPALIRRCTRYQILESYLRHTFSKLMLEYNDKNSDNYGKIVFSQDKKYCYFNTGLLTKYAQDLYLTGEVHALREDGIFTCNNPRFVDSKIELVKHYGFAQRDIDPGPGMASFYRSVSEIVYDPPSPSTLPRASSNTSSTTASAATASPRSTPSARPASPFRPGPWRRCSTTPSRFLHDGPAQLQVRHPPVPARGVEYVGGKRVRYEGRSSS